MNKKCENLDVEEKCTLYFIEQLFKSLWVCTKRFSLQGTSAKEIKFIRSQELCMLQVQTNFNVFLHLCECTESKLGSADPPPPDTRSMLPQISRLPTTKRLDKPRAPDSDHARMRTSQNRYD